MDAKSRANFINSVGTGKVKVCPKCQTPNKIDASFCGMCGEKFEQVIEKMSTASTNSENPFVPVSASEEIAATMESKDERNARVTIGIDRESESVFAAGLPNWSIEPPQILVRRKK